MNLCVYDTGKFLKNANNRHKAFYYHFYTAKKEIFEKEVNKWENLDNELKIITDEISKANFNWQTHELLKNDKNLSGLEINKFHSDLPLQTLYYTNLEYCNFNSCKIVISSDIKDRTHDQPPVFLGSKLNHSYFKNCFFNNVSFMAGEFKNIVFYNCTFNDVAFNTHNDGIYENIFFQNCDFVKVDLENLDVRSFCFWGACTFEDIKFSFRTFPRKHIIGKDIIHTCKKWDEETFEIRKQHQYIGGCFNKIEIESSNGGKTAQKVIKHASVKNIYEGLIELYKYIFNYEDKFGERSLSLQFNYFFKWLIDERDKLINRKNIRRKIFISRIILGYGIKAQKPLIAYLVMILLFSFIYLFTGLRIDNYAIFHNFNFDVLHFNDIIKNYGLALYFSVVTSTTIGYGDIRPDSGLTMALACIQGLLGIFLTTMFTVVFARRFFN